VDENFLPVRNGALEPIESGGHAEQAAGVMQGFDRGAQERFGFGGGLNAALGEQAGDNRRNGQLGGDAPGGGGIGLALVPAPPHSVMTISSASKLRSLAAGVTIVLRLI